MLTGFREWFLSVLKMSKHTLTLRFSKSVINEIKELVDAGEYASYSDFINRATIELLHREQLRKNRMDELKSLLLSEEGRELLRSILDEPG